MALFVLITIAIGSITHTVPGFWIAKDQFVGFDASEQVIMALIFSL